MGYKIAYTDRKTGEARVHRYTGTQNGAEGWAHSLARENDCKAVATYEDDRPLSTSPPEHIISVGNDKPRT